MLNRVPAPEFVKRPVWVLNWHNVLLPGDLGPAVPARVQLFTAGETRVLTGSGIYDRSLNHGTYFLKEDKYHEFEYSFGSTDETLRPKGYVDRSIEGERR